MSEPAAVYEIRPDDRVRVRRHPEWGTGEVLRVSQTLGVYQAKVLFKAPDGEFWTFHTPDALQHRFHLAPATSASPSTGHWPCARETASLAVWDIRWSMFCSP